MVLIAASHRQGQRAVGLHLGRPHSRGCYRSCYRFNRIAGHQAFLAPRPDCLRHL